MKAEGRKVAEMGGLHIVGTERHESRRIDNQLRGRAGRQGDPGSSRFFLSLEDGLMRHVRRRAPPPADEQHLDRHEGRRGARVRAAQSKQIEKAQRRVEEYHFEQRKNLLEYDEVMDYQRKRTYGARQGVLDGENPRRLILEMIDEQIASAVERYGNDTYGAATFAQYAGGELGVEFTAADFRGANYDEAVHIAQERASQYAPSFIGEAMDESLNTDEDPKDWKWIEFTRALTTRYGLKIADAELKAIPRQEMAERLIADAERSIAAVNLNAGARFLERNYGPESLADWARQKFNLRVGLDELADKDPPTSSPC